MRGYMFRNRWFAIVFVCLTLAGVTKLVGTAKEQGTIQQAAGQIAAQKTQAEQLTTDTNAPANAAQDVPYADDEELIDEAVGEDPTPADEFSAEAVDAEGPSDAVTIVSRDAGAAAPGPAPEPAAAPAN